MPHLICRRNLQARNGCLAVVILSLIDELQSFRLGSVAALVH
jgi:hypothetical protein